MSLASGTRLGPYEVVALLGEGGMGEVYRARDSRLERTVAIKILPESLAGDPQFRERFDREARAISQLDHPHICAVYDVGEHHAFNPLVEEAIESARVHDYEGIPVRVVDPEHLIALALLAGGARRRERAWQLLQSEGVDRQRLRAILQKHGVPGEIPDDV